MLARNLGPAIPILLGAIVLFLLLRFAMHRLGYRVRDIMTPGEWSVLAQIVAIILLSMILVIGKIGMEFPVEQFIYGRF